MTEIPEHLRLYDEKYFNGDRTISGYDRYENCRGVLTNWATMVEALAWPDSILDVGCAYGFLVEFFLALDRDAYGVEPSEFALSQVAPKVKNRIFQGALPNLPTLPLEQFTVVTATELLEHVPEELVEASLKALADKTKNLLICLIMLEGPGDDSDAGHITLKSKEWWQAEFTKTGLVERADLTEILDNEGYSRHMNWSGRFFVYEKE